VFVAFTGGFDGELDGSCKRESLSGMESAVDVADKLHRKRIEIRMMLLNVFEYQEMSEVLLEV